jgi:hypothetical protein
LPIERNSRSSNAAHRSGVRNAKSGSGEESGRSAKSVRIEAVACARVGKGERGTQGGRYGRCKVGHNHRAAGRAGRTDAAISPVTPGIVGCRGMRRRNGHQILGGGFGRRLFRNVVFGRGDVVRDRARRRVVAGMGGSHGWRKQKCDHDGRRSHNARKSLLHSHAFTYHGSAILTRFIRGVSKSRVFTPAGGNLQKFGNGLGSHYFGYR